MSGVGLPSFFSSHSSKLCWDKGSSGTLAWLAGATTFLLLYVCRLLVGDAFKRGCWRLALSFTSACSSLEPFPPCPGKGCGLPFHSANVMIPMNSTAAAERENHFQPLFRAFGMGVSLRASFSTFCLSAFGALGFILGLSSSMFFSIDYVQRFVSPCERFFLSFAIA